MKLNLIVIEGPHEGRAFEFGEHENFIVGRGKVAHFRLPVRDKFFSRVHFMVEINPPLCRLLDMASTNGTRVNGQKVRSADLKDGDLIRAGKTVIKVSIQHAGETDVTRAPIPSGSFEHVALAESPERPTPFLAPSIACTPEITKLVSRQRSMAEGTARCRSCEAPASGPLSPDRTGFDIPITLCPICRSRIREHPQPITGYKLVRELGRGGMGVVYLAIREADGSVVALKTITPAVLGSRTQSERFLREARILSQLSHPRIVTFLEMGEESGMFYFAMDYVRGFDLDQVQRDLRGPLPIRRAVDLTCQILEALEYAHDRGCVHRDIKPANVLVEAKYGRDEVKLTDFGLARIYQTLPMSGLTLKGDFGGTMAFIAPEQISDFRAAKPPVDQYALGATLYRLLTDRYIFDLPGRIELQLLMVLQDEPISIRERRPEVPEALADVVHRALAKDPGLRFDGVREMRAALSQFGRER